jgi:hypothetical protein
VFEIWNLTFFSIIFFSIFNFNFQYFFQFGIWIFDTFFKKSNLSLSTDYTYIFLVNDSKRSEFSPKHPKLKFQQLLKKVFYWPPTQDIYGLPYIIDHIIKQYILYIYVFFIYVYNQPHDTPSSTCSVILQRLGAFDVVSQSFWYYT